MKTEISDIFDLLDKWRLLPAYQLERRADIFFAFYLKQILEAQQLDQSVLKIIPEFPIKIDIVDSNNADNRSFKTDYLVITDKDILLIELKTDNRSLTKKQVKILQKTSETSIYQLIDGIIRINKATKSKVKYQRLMEEIESIGWLKKEANQWINLAPRQNPKVLFIKPRPSKKEASNIKDPIYFDEIAAIIEKNDTELSRRFAKSLRKWKKDPNKK